MSQKLFIARLVTGNILHPLVQTVWNCRIRTVLSFPFFLFRWNSPCFYATPATETGLFQGFFNCKRVVSSHPCEMGLAIVTLHISSSRSSGVILYCRCPAQICPPPALFFIFFPSIVLLLKRGSKYKISQLCYLVYSAVSLI